MAMRTQITKCPPLITVRVVRGRRRQNARSWISELVRKIKKYEHETRQTRPDSPRPDTEEKSARETHAPTPPPEEKK